MDPTHQQSSQSCCRRFQGPRTDFVGTETTPSLQQLTPAIIHGSSIFGNRPHKAHTSQLMPTTISPTDSRDFLLHLELSHNMPRLQLLLLPLHFNTNCIHVYISPIMYTPYSQYYITQETETKVHTDRDKNTHVH